MEYVELIAIGKEEAKRILNSSDSEKEICLTLIRVVHFVKDYEWLSDQCVKHLQKENSEICSTTITCVGHLVRVFGKIDKKKIIPIFDKLKNDSRYLGLIEDVYDDIEIFAR